MNAGAHLVDLVQHHHAIARAGFANALNDVAGQGADIGAPVAADLRLVVNAAETDADEPAAHRARDGLAERSLANARRTDEAQDRRLALRRELAHREIFDDSLLDLVETEMVLVEDLARRRDVDGGLLGQSPRQLDQPIEIGAGHAVFGGGVGHPLEPAQLLARGLIDLGRHVRLSDRFRQLGDFLPFAVAFAELALDRRHLLAQQHLALTLVERGLGLAADLLREPQHFDPLREQGGHLVHSGDEIDRFEDVLLLVGACVHIGGD